jgi:probable DNA repair protein
MPFIRVALDLLRWASAPLSIDRVSGLLVSPLFAAGNGEGQARAVFDAVELRKAKLLRPEATLRWMIETVSRVQRMQLSSMLDVLRALERAANRYGLSNSIRPYGEWAEVIHDLLREAKWGRESSEDSVEFQTRKRWEATLDELVTLDFGGTRVGYTDALESLERLARTTTFAPESRDAPVQILGPLEAAGSRFDAIWFLGASDLAWPVSPAANPLLPWALQVELGMPGTEVQADDARDRRLAQRIAASGDVVVVFSYSTEMVAVKQRPAPAVLALQPVVEPLEVISPPDALEPVQTLELFADTISLPPTPDKEMQGGADIFRLQAACAFRAFAEKRVWSTDLRAVELGLDSGERGNVVHRSMEHFWNKVQTQAELKRLSASQRMEALDEAIEHGLHRVAAISSGDWGNAYIEVQRRRLRNILSSWLELELLRDPFEVKLSEKELRDAQIGPLRLRIRVDRIDATEAGDVIIDYKTGRAKTVEWQGERPDAPQLPLYAVLSDALRDRTDLADVAFASIRAGRDMVLDGFVSKITSAGKRDSRNRISLSEQLDQWGQVLVNLATQFHEGDVRVDPKKYPGTCKYCAQRTLCRINPAATEIDEDFDLDDEAANDIGNG